MRLRLDLVAAVQLTPEGEPRTMHYAYNAPVRDDGGVDPSAVEVTGDGTLPYHQVGPVPLGRVDVDFGELIQALEDEFAKRSRARAVTGKDGRAILVHVGEKAQGAGASPHAEESLRELRELARTRGRRR